MSLAALPPVALRVPVGATLALAIADRSLLGEVSQFVAVASVGSPVFDFGCKAHVLSLSQIGM